MTRIKRSFVLDERSIALLDRLAKVSQTSRSQIVRTALTEYCARELSRGGLTDAERSHLLRVFDEMVPKIPRRPLREIEAELAEIRAARRGGGRRTPVE